MSTTAPAGAVPFPELTRQQKVFTFVGTLLALLLGALDQTVVATAGPTIALKLNIEPSLYTWITTSYLVASTVLVPVWGKLSDLYGRKAIIISGITLFLLASMLCGAAQNTLQLVLFRALQGMGSASLFTTAFAVVADLFPPAERGKYSGIFGGVFGLASLIGPLLGGFITDHFGWHWVFFINLPVGAVALAFIVTRMPPLKRHQVERPTIDFAGAALLAVAVVPLLVGLTFGRRELSPGGSGWLWGSWQIAALFGTAAVGLASFLAVELKVRHPLIDLTLFKGRVFSVGSATVFVMGSVFLAPIIFLPLFMVNVVGVSSTGAGISTLPLVLGILVGNIGSGQIVSRLGRYKVPMLAGLLVLLVGLGVMSFTLSPTETLGSVTVKMVLVGLGLGPSIPLYTIAIQNAVPVQQLGSATSVVTFFRQMGSTVGIGIAGAVFASTLTSDLREKMAAATAGLPPSVAQSFAPRGPGGSASGEGPGARGPRFDAEAVKAQVQGSFNGARVLATKALGGDQQAATALAHSPFVEPRLQAVLLNGGPRGAVQKSFATMWSHLEAAAADPARWAALQQSNELPAAISTAMAATTPAVLADPAARAGALAQLRSALETQERAAEQTAVAQARERVEAAIDGANQAALRAVDAVGAALKQSFTDAVSAVYRLALWLALLAVVLTVLLPELPLRRGNAPAPAAAAE